MHIRRTLSRGLQITQILRNSPSRIYSQFRKNKILSYGTTLTLGILTLGVLSFQNCAPGSFRILDTAFPPVGSFDTLSCGASMATATNTAVGGVDACVYLKNPYYQQMSKSSSTNSEILPPPLFGVSLSGLDDSGYLKNADLQIIADYPVKKINDHDNQNGKWHYYSTPQDGIAQFSAYYYAQHILEFARRKIPTLTLSNLKINIGSSESGWAPSTNEIYLKRDSSGADLAYDGSLITYFTALVIINKLSNGAAQVASDDPNHSHCGPSEDQLYENDCCRNSVCTNALTSGMADYLVGVIFSEAPILSPPTLGEYPTNRASGLGHCGLSRNLTEVYTLYNAYHACKSAPAQIQNLGSVYGQIWWQAREEARKALQPSEFEKFDEFFLAHIEKLTNQDSDVTLLNKAQQIDTNKFQGKFFKYLNTTLATHQVSIR